MRAATFVLLLVTACARQSAPTPDGVPRIDGRSDAAYEQSLRRLKDTLTNEEQARFCDAVLTILVRDGAAAVAASGGDPLALRRRQRERLHGMSAADVHAAAATPR